MTSVTSTKSVVVQNFYDKTRAQVGAEQLLTLVETFTQTVSADFLFCSSSRRQGPVFTCRDEALVPPVHSIVWSTKVQSPCSVEHKLRLLEKIIIGHTSGLYLRTLASKVCS